jgi:curved DNA-binding protein
MDYKDYYRTLGVERRRGRRSSAPIASWLASTTLTCGRRQGGRGQVQRDQRGLRGAGRSGKRKKYDQFGANWERFQQTGGQPGAVDWSQWAGGAGAPGGGHYTSVNVDELRDLFGDGFSSPISSRSCSAARRPQGAGASRARGRDVEQDVPITLREARGATRILQRTRQMEIKIPAGAATARVRVSGRPTGLDGGHRAIVPEGGRAPDAHTSSAKATTCTPGARRSVHGGAGRRAPVKTLTGGTLLVRIPAGTQNGSTIRLRGKGMPHLRESGQHGDLLVKILVRLPRHLSDRERELFEELRKLQSH